MREYARRLSCDVLIETGTYLGDMVFAFRKQFQKIISMELDRNFFATAKHRFVAHPHRAITHGDSATVLPSVLNKEHGCRLFWLDGHYSGGETARGERETPIMEELRHIKSFSDDSVILIDDGRLFVGKDDYPTLSSLGSFVRELWREHDFDVRDDVIRISPRTGAVR